jgi:hypothetical protein
MQRAKLPKRIVDLLMVSNKHTCCLCRNEYKDTEIHHIDGDKTNNTLDNLAVVCRDCHSKITGARGLGRKYSAYEVKENKRHWEYKTRSELGMVSRSVTNRSLITDNVRSEMRRIIYELAIAEEAAVARDKSELLWIYCVFEGENDTNFVLDALHKVVPFLAGNKSGPVAAEFVPRLFYHLPDPKEVKITKKDLTALKRAIETLSYLGRFSAEFMTKILTPKSCINSLYELFVTVTAYRLKPFISQILNAIRDIKQAATEGAKENRKMKQVVIHSQKIEKKIREAHNSRN